MGTTLVATYTKNNHLYWVSVGDSPLLFYRRNTLRRLNADHSYQAVLDAQVKSGQLSPAAARQDPRRSQLFSALCGKDVEYVDHQFNPTPLQSGDIIISASDGILSLPADDIAALLTDSADPERIAEDIIASVINLNRPGQDNTSVIVQTVEDA